MGPSILYAWLPWFRIYSATRWDAPLSCQSPALSPGAPSRAEWLPAGVVRGAHRLLPFLSLACAVSRKQHHDQTAPGERRVVATRLLTRSFLLSTHGRASR